MAEAPDVETSSADYARRFAGPVGRFFLEVQAAATLHLLRPWPGASVLDVGGGHGQSAGVLADAGYRTTVYASAPVCRERVAALVDAGRVSFRCGDLRHLACEDRSFDVALSYRLISHVSEWRALVQELCRVARTAVIIDYPTRRSVNVVSEALFGLKRGVEGNTRPFLVFRDAEVAEALRAAGFEVTARRPQFFFPMALHRAFGVASLARGVEGLAGALGLVRGLGSPVILKAERRG